MQNVFIEKPYQFVPPVQSDWIPLAMLKFGFLERSLRKREGVEDCEIRNLDVLKRSIDAGHSVVLTPNHPRTADPMVICHLARQLSRPFFMMASWHLFNQGWFSKLAIRAMGAFSVYREGLDKQAVDFAVKSLQEARRPLVIFPEGTTSRTNDQLMAFMEGPAFIARTAARRRQKSDGGKVVIHPVAIRYLYQGDIHKTLPPVLDRLERALTWSPQSELPLPQRMIKVGVGLLTAKEQQFDRQPQPETPLRERQSRLVDHLLQPLEEKWLGGCKTDGVAIRVKNLRVKLFSFLLQHNLSVEERRDFWKQIEATYVAQQVDGYPDRYLTEFTSVERVFETCEKLEEDAFDQVTVHGDLKAIVDICDPIEVSPKRDKSGESDPLMTQVQAAITEKLIESRSECRMYDSRS